MKKKSYGILLVVVLSAAISGTGIAFADDMKIDIRIAPSTLNLDNVEDKCVTVHAGIPYNTVNTDPTSLTLETDEGSVTAIGTKFDQRGNLVVKFDREAVAGIVDAGNEVTLTLDGETKEETTFTGSDTIRVIE